MQLPLHGVAGSCADVAAIEGTVVGTRVIPKRRNASGSICHDTCRSPIISRARSVVRRIEFSTRPRTTMVAPVRDACSTMRESEARGIDMLNTGYNYLDLVPKGRDEAGLPSPMAWLRLRDSY